MTPCGNNGWEQQQKDQKSDSSFGLSSLFHNTPEKMPAKYSIFQPQAGTFKVLTGYKTKVLLAVRRQIQCWRVALLHCLIKGRHIRGHELLPGRQLFVQLTSQHFEHVILLL